MKKSKKEVYECIKDPIGGGCFLTEEGINLYVIHAKVKEGYEMRHYFDEDNISSGIISEKSLNKCFRKSEI